MFSYGFSMEAYTVKRYKNYGIDGFMRLAANVFTQKSEDVLSSLFADITHVPPSVIRAVIKSYILINPLRRECAIA